MNINVTTTKVSIDNESLNKGEYNVRECNFNLAEEYEGLVCKALFTVTKTKLTYEQSIVNGKCNIPYEATVNRGKVIVGVIGYEVNDEELVKRYSPEPDEFFVLDGSYIEDIENQSTPTPSELEQLEQRVASIELDAEQVETNTQDISNIKQEQIIQNENIQTNADNISTLQGKVGTNETDIADIKQEQTTQNTNITNLQTNKADKSEIPDVSDFITKDVNDLTNYTLTTETGSQIELNLNNSNFKMTATLKDKNGNTVDTSNEIDLPLESVVVNASYDNTTKEIILTLQNGNTVRFSVADLVSGLVSYTDYASSNKGGVIKTSSTNSFGLTSSGYPACVPITYDNYTQKDSYAFISKGTLENVITGKQLINKTQLDESQATQDERIETLEDNVEEIQDVLPLLTLPEGNSEQDGEPSPTNEVPIYNVTGDVEVLLQNKNLFDKTNQYANNYYDDNGNEIISTNSGHFANKIKVKPNTQYTMSGFLIGSNLSNFTRIYFYDSNSNWISRSDGITTVPNTFTTPSNCEYINFQLNNNPSYPLYSASLDTFMVLEGAYTSSNIPSYVPHKEQTYTFPLGTQRMYLGDYLADDGIHSKRNQYALQGEDIASLNSQGSTYFSVTVNKFTNIISKESATDILCNMLKASSSTVANSLRIVTSSGNIILIFATDFADYNLTAVRTKIQSLYDNGTPLILEIPLAEEEITPYTEPQQQAYDEIKQAVANKEHVNISATSDEADPLFSEVTYQDVAPLVSVDLLENKIEALQTENARLKATLPTTTGEGENITLDKTAEMEFVQPPLPRGNSEQVQYDGRQLLNTNVTSLSFDTSNTGNKLIGNIELEANQKYYISYNVENATSSNERNTPQIRLASGGTTYYQYSIANQNLTAGRKVWEFTSSESGNYILAYWCHTPSSVVTVSNFMVSTSSDIDYEPYVGKTASPNPSYTQPITNLTGDVEVLVQNKNLVELLDLVKLSNEYTQSGNGYTFSSKQSMYSTGVELDKPLELPISFSYKIKNGTGQNFRLRFWFDDGTIQAMDAYSSGTSTSEVFITANNITKAGATKITKIGADFSNQYTTFTITDFIINYGTTATTYTPHKEQVKTFPLGTQRMYLGDYLADDGIHHVMKRIVLNGNENESWTLNSTQTVFVHLIDKTGKYISGSTVHNILANQCKSKAFTTLYNGSEDYGIAFGASAGDRLCVRNKDITTVENWRTWLSTHNVTVEYELAEEEITPYTTEQQQAYDEIKQAFSYEEQTNISGSSDESNPIFSVEAYQSLKLVLAG